MNEPRELTRVLTADYIEQCGELATEYGEEHRWYTTWIVTFRDPLDGTEWQHVRCDDKTEMGDLDWWHYYPDSEHITCRRAAVRQITVDEWYEVTS